jgi:hypothetical protein
MTQVKSHPSGHDTVWMAVQDWCRFNMPAALFFDEGKLQTHLRRGGRCSDWNSEPILRGGLTLTGMVLRGSARCSTCSGNSHHNSVLTNPLLLLCEASHAPSSDA